VANASSIDYITNFRKKGGIRGAASNRKATSRTTTGKQTLQGQTYLPATGQVRRGTASGAPTSSVLNMAPISAASTSPTVTQNRNTGYLPAEASSRNQVDPAIADNNLMDQEFTGWAQGLKPDAAQMLFQEPQALLRQVLAKMGMSANDNPGLYYQSLPNADLVNALAMLQLGGSSDFNQGNINSVINTMGNMFQQGATRGGTGINFQGGLANAMNAGTGTALGDFLNLDDPRGQVQAMSSLLMPLAEASLHPLFQQAFQAEIGRLADEFYSRSAFGDTQGDFQDLLARRLNVGGLG
jgi:hypothetical protein